jgi:large subunit ribosomal protein L32
MAVQQNKKSPSKRGMHRSHDFLTNPPLAVEPTTGEVHLRHHVSPTGFYKWQEGYQGNWRVRIWDQADTFPVSGRCLPFLLSSI